MISKQQTLELYTEEIRTFKDLVLQVLAQSERARNNDEWLIVLVKSYARCNSQLKGRTLSSETITRCRRKIQNEEGLYPPTEETSTKRKINQIAHRNWSIAG